jgi:methyl-accepting chemotaxis protein
MPSQGRRKRSYLLDPRFQLKWTAYLVVVVVAVMAALGYIIARTASRASDTAALAVKQAKLAFEESKANNALTLGDVELTTSDPSVAAVMKASLADVDAKSEKNLADVRQRKDEIARDRSSLQILLAVTGGALTVVLLLMGILITHRIVGPVHKMKRLLRRVSTGRLVIDERLRKGDELEELFETFLQMTFSLRALQSARIATLDGVLRRAEATGAAADVIEGLRALRAQMVLGMEKRHASRPAPAMGSGS